MVVGNDDQCCLSRSLGKHTIAGRVCVNTMDFERVLELHVDVDKIYLMLGEPVKVVLRASERNGNFPPLNCRPCFSNASGVPFRERAQFRCTPRLCFISRETPQKYCIKRRRAARVPAACADTQPPPCEKNNTLTRTYHLLRARAFAAFKYAARLTSHELPRPPDFDLIVEPPKGWIASATCRARLLLPSCVSRFKCISGVLLVLCVFSPSSPCPSSLRPSSGGFVGGAIAADGGRAAAHELLREGDHAAELRDLHGPRELSDRALRRVQRGPTSSHRQRPAAVSI